MKRYRRKKNNWGYPHRLGKGVGGLVGKGWAGGKSSGWACGKVGGGGRGRRDGPKHAYIRSPTWLLKVK